MSSALQNPGPDVIDRFGIVTSEFGHVTGHFGDVTDGRYAMA